MTIASHSNENHAFFLPHFQDLQFHLGAKVKVGKPNQTAIEHRKPVTETIAYCEVFKVVATNDPNKRKQTLVNVNGDEINPKLRSAIAETTNVGDLFLLALTTSTDIDGQKHNNFEYVYNITQNRLQTFDTSAPVIKKTAYSFSINPLSYFKKRKNNFDETTGMLHRKLRDAKALHAEDAVEFTKPAMYDLWHEM